MKYTLFLAIMFLTAHAARAQQRIPNPGFERIDPATKLPERWDLTARQFGAGGYLTKLDSGTVAEGRYCVSIEPDPATSDHNFGACAYTFPVDFNGKKITLKAFLKTENVGEKDYSGLWMTIYGESGELDSDEMQDRTVRGTTGWTEYAIDLALPAEARKITVGGLLIGDGKIWVDNFRVFVDDKPLDELPVSVPALPAAQRDTAFNRGSGIRIGALTPARTADLALLGKVWGFLKYHHPRVAAGDLNWDYELFRFLPGYLGAKTPKERDALLTGWIESLGKLPECDACREKTSGSYHIVPDLAWIDDERLESKLRKKLHYVLERRNQEKHYHLSFAPNIGNPVFKNENPYKGFTYPDEGFRLLAVYRYWNVIQYFFPYRDVIGENWHDVLTMFIPKVLEAKDALSYKLAVREMIGRVNDTHANLWIQDEELKGHFGRLRPAIQVRFAENQAVVAGYYQEELGKETGLAPGDVIVAIAGVPVAERLKKMLPIYPASNYPTKLRDIARDLLRSNAPTLVLTVLRDGRPTDVTVECHDPAAGEFDMMIDRAYNRPDSCYRLLTPDIGYIYLGNIQQAKLPLIFEKFKNTRGIVIDIRNYPSEFVVFSLGRYLMPEPVEFVRFTSGSAKSPGMFSMGPTLEVGEENPNYYKGKVTILVNEISQSQAEYTTMALRRAPGATVIGSTTAGADGNVSQFALPGGLNTMISGIGVFYPDEKPTQRVGIVPDITVTPTIAGIRAGRDELLEKAMEVIMK